ncbi:MAG: hypothetical protein HC913_06675 [Microscillaceae bacterium]|nr:hypothetical protein [Microscillaceae bacterium]
MHYLISLYISIWSSFAYNYIEQLPKPRYTAQQEYRQFVRYQENRIWIPYPKSTFQQYHQALDALLDNRQAKVNIVHIGDSHIQADFWSHQVRQHFQEERSFGNGGRGYVFPYSMAKAHDPFNLKVNYTGLWQGCKSIQLSRTCSWGLGGMTATTTDSLASFTIDPNSRTAQAYPISRVKVYYNVREPKNYFVNLVTENGLQAPCALSADGYAEFCLPSPQEKVTFRLEKRFPTQSEFTLEGISLENDQRGVQYHAVGVNGATVLSYLKVPNLEPQLHSLSPDLVIISLGTNDAYTTQFDAEAYKRNLSRLISRIRMAAPRTSVLITTPGDCGLPGGIINPSNQAARQKIFELGEEMDCAVWDLYMVMGGYGSVKRWLKEGLSAGDLVHLTGKGYRLQGDLLYDALVQDYLNHRLGQ